MRRRWLGTVGVVALATVAAAGCAAHNPNGSANPGFTEAPTGPPAACPDPGLVGTAMGFAVTGPTVVAPKNTTFGGTKCEYVSAAATPATTPTTVGDFVVTYGTTTTSTTTPPPPSAILDVVDINFYPADTTLVTINQIASALGAAHVVVPGLGDNGFTIANANGYVFVYRAHALSFSVIAEYNSTPQVVAVAQAVVAQG